MIRFITKSYKRLQNRRTAFYAVMSLIFTGIFVFMLNISPVWAGTYTVEDIEVDVSAANAVEAREKAFEEAQIKGYKMLAEKFLSAEELETFETPDIAEVSLYVKDFEVSQEKLSATRYAGVYKIRYSSRAFSNKGLKGNNTTSQGQSGKAQRGDILVLPFFEEGGYPALWRSNPFMQAWIRARENNKAAPSIVPMGDAQDISAIKDNEALRYDPQKLLVLKKRYRAPQAAILIATPELMPDGTQNVAVGIYKAKSFGPELSRQISVRSHLGEGREQFYNRVVAAVNKFFNESWKSETAVLPKQLASEQPLTGPIHTMVAQVSFSTMRQWVDTKRSLERTRGVRNVSVKSLSPRRATLTINYQGGIENLRESLGKNGLGLNDPLTQYNQMNMGQSAVYQLTPRF